jgi:vacuole morphology and inheritance protein 14
LQQNLKYETRKASAYALEHVFRELHRPTPTTSNPNPAPSAGDKAKIPAIIDQLCALFLNQTNSQSARNGGLLGLAACAIALGEDVGTSPSIRRDAFLSCFRDAERLCGLVGTVDYFPMIIPKVLSCFTDPDNRVRYFAVECIVSSLAGLRTCAKKSIC